MNWLTHVCFVVTFFVVPIISWIHIGVSYSDDVFVDCYMNVWFVAYFLLNFSHIFIGIYASIKSIGKVEKETPTQILV